MPVAVHRLWGKGGTSSTALFQQFPALTGETVFLKTAVGFIRQGNKKQCSLVVSIKDRHRTSVFCHLSADYRETCCFSFRSDLVPSENLLSGGYDNHGQSPGVTGFLHENRQTMQTTTETGWNT